MKDFSAKAKEISMQMEGAIRDGDLTGAQALMQNKDALIDNAKATNVRIHIVFGNLSDNGARLTTSDYGYTIILPEIFQNVIRNSTNGWNNGTLLAKNLLRKKTIHELGHVIFNHLIKCEYDENDIELFVDALTDMRNKKIS